MTTVKSITGMKSHIGIFIIALISSINAFLFPDGYEIRYDYRGAVEAFDSVSQHLASQFELLSEIIIQNPGNGSNIRIHLDNVRYGMYVGSGNTNGEEVPLPEDRKRIIQLPFVLINKENKYSIKAHKEDKPWSVKIKESIALVMKVDEKFLIDVEVGEVHTNNTKENYGYREGCRATYTVKNKGDEYSVMKSISLRDCGYHFIELTSMPKHKCIEPSNKHDLQRYIIVSKDLKGMYIKNIHSYASFGMNFNAFFANMNQSVSMKSILKIEEGVEIDEYIDVSELNNDKESVEKYVGKVKIALESVADYLETMDIDLSDAIGKNQENIIALVEYMKHLEEKDFLKLFNEIQNMNKDVSRMRDIFLTALPVVRTRGAIMAVRHLILEKSVDNDTAVSMLHNLFTYRLSENDFFVQELEDLTKDSSGLSDMVRHVATLIFATTITTAMATMQNLPDDSLDQYATNMSQKLIESKDYSEKFLSVIALSNMQTGNIYSILEDVIQGKGAYKDFDPHLRTLAMLSCIQDIKVALGDKRTKSMQDILMLIVQNKKEHFEARLIALYVLLEISQPKIWTELYWYMSTEENEDIRSLFYSSLKKFGESSLDCMNSKVHSVKQLIKLIPKDAVKISSIRNQLYDYLDSLRLNGYVMEVVYFGDLNAQKFMTIIVKYSYAVQSSMFDTDTIYLHLKLRDDYDKDVEMSLNVLGGMSSEDLTVEVIIFKNNMASFAEVSKPTEIFALLANLMKTYKNYDRTALKRFENYNSAEPLDFGILAVEYLKVSSVQNVKSEVEISDVDFTYKSIDNLEYGLKILNPLTNVWHGIRRVQKVDVLFGMYFDLEVYQNLTQKNNWRPFGNESKSTGFRSMGHTEVYVSGESSEEMLRKSCPSCKTLDIFKKNRKNFTIWEDDDENTGLLYKFKIFDCDEEDVTNHIAHFKQIIRDRMEKLNIKSILLTVLNLWFHITLSPGYGTCGIGFSVEPSENYPLVNFEFFNFNPEFKNDKIEYSMRAKNDDKLVKSWDLTIERKSEKNFMNQLSMNLKESTETSTISETCVEFKRHFEDRKYHGKMEVFQGETCDRQKANFSMKITAEESEEQKAHPEKETRIYEECISDPRYQGVACATKATALRRYDFDIRYDSLPSGTWRDFYYLMKNMYGVDNYDENSKTDTGRAEVVLVYPLSRPEEMDISVYGPSESFDIPRLSLDHTLWPRFLEPQSAFEFNSFLNFLDCEVRTDRRRLPGEFASRAFNMSNESKIAVLECVENGCEWINLRKVSDDKIGMLVTIGGEDLDFQLKEKIEIVLNEVSMQKEPGKYHETKATKFKILDGQKSVLIHIKNSPTVIGFDGKTVRISSIKEKFHGLCAI